MEQGKSVTSKGNEQVPKTTKSVVVEKWVAKQPNGETQVENQTQGVGLEGEKRGYQGMKPGVEILTRPQDGVTGETRQALINSDLMTDSESDHSLNRHRSQVEETDRVFQQTPTSRGEKEDATRSSPVVTSITRKNKEIQSQEARSDTTHKQLPMAKERTPNVSFADEVEGFYHHNTVGAILVPIQTVLPCLTRRGN